MREPRSETITTLQEILSEVTGFTAADLPLDQNVLELGISSLVLVDAFRLIQERLSVRPSIRRVFNEFDTLRLLAAYVDQLLEEGVTTPPPAPLRLPTRNADAQVLDLHPSLRHLAFLAGYSEQASTAFNEAVLLRLQGPLELPVLEEALDEVYRRHESLRSRLREDGRLGISAPETAQSLSVHEPDADDTAAVLSTLCAQHFSTDTQLFQASVLSLTEDEHLLLLVGHALIVDRIALQQVAWELGALYSAGVSGEPAGLSEPVPLSHTFEALTRLQSSSASDLSWWEQRLRADAADGPAPLEPPSDHPRPTIKQYTGARVALPLESELSDALRSWSRSHGASASMAVLAVLSAMLDRISTGDVTIGLLARHSLAALSGSALVAGLVNPLPLHLPRRDDASLGGWLEQVRDHVADAFDHQDVAFSDLVQRIAPARDRSRSALFTVGFEVLARPEAPSFIDLDASWMTPPSQGCRYDLHFTLVESPRGLSLQCDYSTELYARGTVVSWLKQLRSLLQRSPSLDAVPLQAISLLSSDEQSALLRTWDQRDGSPPTDRLESLIGAQASQHPDRIAIRHADGSVRYGELWQRAGAIAAALQANGVRPEDAVGVCLPRNPDLIAAILGILRAGAAWVPIISGQPEGMVSMILEDASVRLTLCDGETRASLPEQAPLLSIDGLPAAAPTPIQAGSDALAYIYFTSGSTGRPKGVALEHRNLAALLDAMSDLPQSDLDNMLMSTSIAFDVSLFELFVPLTRGGSICLIESILHLPESPFRDEITSICAVPSVLEPLLSHHGLPAGLHAIFLGGEAARSDTLLPALREACPTARIYNAYGPTEDAVYSIVTDLQPGLSVRALSQPVRHSRMLVLDRCGHVAAPGTDGELLLGGAGVSRGYVGRPELTAARFVHVSEALGGDRMYWTGDTVRVLSDGSLRYIGRRDDQVKLRGYRIELGGIRRVLAQQPGVDEAAVVMRDFQGASHILAYVAGPGAGDTDTLRQTLARHFPAYSVPSWIIDLPALPRLLSGKVDGQALPLPTLSQQEGRSSPQTTTEQLLGDIWRAELEVDEVRVEDDFFQLGGTSLRMTAMMLTIRKTFRVQPRLRSFFDHPTLGEFAAHLEQLIARPDAREPVREQRAEERFAWLAKDAILAPELTPDTPISEGPMRRVFMTGATGFVGTHILKELLLHSDVTAVCLVRGDSEAACRARLMRSMGHYGLEDGIDPERIVVIPGGLGTPRLGLSQDAYDALADSIDAIYHGAAMVNFIYPYHALKAVNVEGTRAVIQLAFHKRRKPIHYVSTAAIWPMGGHRRFAAEDSIDHNIDLNMGYDESKWVAEKMLGEASRKGLPVSIYRPGEVAGHSRTGQSEEGHFLFAMFKGCLQIGAFPNLSNLLDLSPVDYVAESIAHLMLNETPGQSFHITNPYPMTIPELYSWMRHIGYAFEELPFETWKQLLLSQEDLRSNALYPYASLIDEFEKQNMELPQYDCSRAQAALQGTGIDCAGVAPPLLNRYVDYLISIGFLNAPSPDFTSDRV